MVYPLVSNSNIFRFSCGSSSQMAPVGIPERSKSVPFPAYVLMIISASILLCSKMQPAHMSACN